MAISYVGGMAGGRAGSTATAAVTFALTGGTNSTPQAGDLVVIALMVGSQGRNAAQAVVTPSGYTAFGQLNSAAATYDTSLNVSWKIMGGTPDTSFTRPSTGNVADAQSYTVQVWRNFDPTNPFDVAAVSAIGSATGRPNPAAITPVTAGAVIGIIGAGSASAGATYVAPANYTTNFLTNRTNDTNDSMIGAGYRLDWASGAEDPAGFTGGTTNAADSWAAYTYAIRPAPVNPDITLPLTGAQVTASAGTLTASQQVSKALTGAQVAASAGNVTASQADPNKPILISTTIWQQDLLGTSGTPGAKAITVPADAQGVIVQVASTMASTVPSLSISSDFAGTFTIINSNDQDGCSIGYAEVTSTGSKNLTLAWTEGIIEGPSVYISFIKNINLLNWVRATLAESTGAGSGNIATSISSGDTDLILVVDEQDGSMGTPAAMSGCSTLATTDGTYNSASRFQSVDNPSGSSTSLTGTATLYATMTAVSIKQSGGDVNVVLTGAQVTASAGTLTASQQVSKALTGAQVAASAGTLGKQVSVTLTGAQATASAGTVAASQALTRALTGVQVTASAGTLTASQQVTKALTGEQVSALAGTITPSQSTGNVDVALTGAQVAAQAGSVTASQQVTKALTGVQVTAQAGTVAASQQVTKALTGAQVAASAGSVGKQITKALTGVQVAAQSGTVTAGQQVTKALNGAQVAAQAGTVGVTQSTNDVTVALTGEQVAASAGTVIPSQAVTKALTGAQVAASAGSVTTSQLVSLTLTGTQAAANAGSLIASQQVTKALTGVQIAAQAGTVGKQITIALTGAQVAASTGAVTTSQTSFVTLTGAQVTAEAGTLIASQQKSVALTGAQVAGQAGTVGKQFELFRGLTGAEVTAQAGTVTSSQNITIALTGAQATAEAGALTTTQALTLALTGAQVSVQAGSLTAQREFFTALFGSQITGDAGSLTTSQALTRTLIGSQAQAHAGLVDAGVSLSLFVNIPLQGARVVALAGQFANTTGQCGYNRGRVVNE